MLKSQVSNQEQRSTEIPSSKPLAQTLPLQQQRRTPPIDSAALPSPPATPITRPVRYQEGSQKRQASPSHLSLSTASLFQTESSRDSLSLVDLRSNTVFRAIQSAPDLFAMTTLEQFNHSQKKVSYQLPSDLYNIMSHSPRSADKRKPGFHLDKISQASYNELGNYALECLIAIHDIYARNLPVFMNCPRLLKPTLKQELERHLANKHISTETHKDLKRNEKFASAHPGATLIDVDITELLQKNQDATQYCYDYVSQHPELYDQEILIRVKGKTVSVFLKWIQSHLIKFFISKFISEKAPVNNTGAGATLINHLSAHSHHPQAPVLAARKESSMTRNTTATFHHNLPQPGTATSFNLNTIPKLPSYSAASLNHAPTFFHNSSNPNSHSRSAFTINTRHREPYTTDTTPSF